MKLNPENRPFYRRSDDLSDFEILMNILNVFAEFSRKLH